MPEAISNTSPLLYLHRIDATDWLSKIFGNVWIPQTVADELKEGSRRGHEVPKLDEYDWLIVKNPLATPSEWLSLELGPGELAAKALALEHPERIVLLDDLLARRIAQAAGLNVWGTLKVLLEAKALGLTEKVEPLIARLREAGMWISDDIRERILALADELPE